MIVPYIEVTFDERKKNFKNHGDDGVGVEYYESEIYGGI